MKYQAVIYLSFFQSFTKTRIKNEWQLISHDTIRLKYDLIKLSLEKIRIWSA